MDPHSVGQQFAMSLYHQSLWFLLPYTTLQRPVVCPCSHGPLLLVQVEYLQDVPSAESVPGEDPETLSKEVEALMKDVIRLSNKVGALHNFADVWLLA
jgi:hypothetical protein